MFQVFCFKCQRPLFFDFDKKTPSICSDCGGDRRTDDDRDQAAADNRRLAAMAGSGLKGEKRKDLQ